VALLWDGSGWRRECCRAGAGVAGACPRVQGHAVRPPMNAMAAFLWDGSGGAGSAAERARVPAGACPCVQGRPVRPPVEAMAELS
jgi:hypothetical protein